MDFTCSQCGADAPRGEREERRGAVVCPACREVHPLLGGVHRTSCARPWAGLHLESRPGGLELRARWARWNSLVPLLFLLVWLAFVTSWYVFVGPLLVSFASWRSVFNLFPLLCTVAILAFTYYVFARLANATRTHLDERGLAIAQRPLPLQRAVRVPVARVRRVAVRQRSARPPEQRHVETKGARYDVEAVLDDGRRLALAPDLFELERALNLKRVVEGTLAEIVR